MTRTRNALGLLIVLLSACGTQREPPQILPAPVEAPVSILLLDPAGRLLMDDHRVHLWLVTADGASMLSSLSDHWVIRLRELPPPGTQLLVFSPGCKPQLTDLTPGRNVVRLEAGVRARVTIVGERPNTPESGSVGLSLTQRVDELAGVHLPSILEVRSVGASAFDDDLAWMPNLIPIPLHGVVDVILPVNGAYQLRWIVNAPNHSSSIGSKETLLVDSDAITMDVEWGTRDINAAIKRIEGGR